MAKPYLGFSAADQQSTYGPFFNNQLATLPEDVQQALAKAPLRWDDLPDPAGLPSLEQPGYTAHEIGYALQDDGSAKVAVKTHMPGVTPAMWDWWFGWHSSQDQRYKLWHPASHLSARWQDGRSDVCYVGRNSVIREYIGPNPLDALIQFQSPLAFGFSPEALNHPEQAVYICAKIGHPDLPVDYGYLVHQVRAVPGGSEMRSRFCLGGQFVGSRIPGKLAAAATGLLSKFKPMPEHFARDLMHHCAEEMHHLAALLPALYQQFGTPQDLALSSPILRRSDAGFEQKLRSTLFNKLDPGQRPAMIAEPRTVDEVIRIVRWAKAVGKRITISSGGHSFSANFVREDAVLLLMKHFDQYTVDKEAMRAQAGPGVGGSVLMKALYKENLFFPAGHCKGVCIGGYLLQGGYGWNSRELGIACQSVVGLDIVTADGELLHANAEQNADLFWAARGAGPGFFGVVVQFYLKVYPLPPYRAVMAHNFAMKHLEDVYRWAYDAGPTIPKAVEFQMIMNRNMVNLMGPGIEAIAPIFADTREEFEEAQAFMLQSPIKKKAMIATPAFNPGIDMLYKTAMAHYPSDHHWGVDNMWTHASIDELLPFISAIAETLPPAPSHFLWLNWHPGQLETDMAYSKEDKLYLALYSCWKNAKDTALYGNWALDTMKKMEHLSAGIQLADEGLHRRPAAFMSAENLKKVQAIRAERDPGGVFLSGTASRPCSNVPEHDAQGSAAAPQIRLYPQLEVLMLRESILCRKKYSCANLHQIFGPTYHFIKKATMVLNRRNWLKKAGLGIASLGLTQLETFAAPGSAAAPDNWLPDGPIRLSSNENPYGPSPLARQAFAQHMPLSNRYDWELTNTLVTALAQRNGLKQENIVLGAGSTEIIDLVLRLAAARKGNFVTADPSYPYWMDTAQALQLQKNTVPLTPDKQLNLPAMLRAINTKTQLVYICNPNNPTGTVCDHQELVHWIERVPKHTLVLVDEAYLDFTDRPSVGQLVLQHPNLVVAKTFSKIYGLAGARVGYGMAHSSTIERLSALQSWPNGSVSVASTAAAIASLEDRPFVADTYWSNQKVRQYTLEQLERLGLRSIPSFSNFVYFSLDNYKKDFFQQLKNNNVLGTRIYEDQGKWTRITIGTQAEMEVFISALE